MDIFSNLPVASRLWVYVADRSLNPNELNQIEMELKAFTNSWTAHEVQLQAGATILYNQVVLIAVNEAYHGISGCGIDKSVKLMKDLGAALNVDFFNRFLALVQTNDKLLTLTKSGMQEALDAGEIEANSLVLNPLSQTIGEFNKSNFVPLHSFWMAPQLKFLAER